MPLFSLLALPQHLKELVLIISMLNESCSILEQPTAEQAFLWSKQSGRSSASRGIGGGCFGGSDERKVSWCKLQPGPQHRRRRRLQSLRQLEDTVWQEPR